MDSERKLEAILELNVDPLVPFGCHDTIFKHRTFILQSFLSTLQEKGQLKFDKGKTFYVKT